MSQNLTGSIVFGAIEENYIDENGKYICQGYCQKAGSKENVMLDIYIDDERIAQIEANEHIKPIEDTYMIDGHCFTYEVDTDYCDRDKTLFIKEHDSQQELMHSGLKLKYNEPLFLNSLDTPYPRKQLKGMYQKDTFGFLALEENLDDERFVDYIKELMQRFEKARWSAFCFTKKQRELLEQTLGEYSAKIECILPKNIKDIALGCEVFIYSKQKRTDRSQSAPFDKLSTQIANKTDLFQIMLTPEGETELILGSELEYTKSIVSQIFAGEREEAFYKFMDINATIDAQKLKTLHKKDHIGFFASAQNLNNRSFVSYVKKLHKSFPQLRLVAYYFHDEELELFKKSFDEDAKDIKAIKPKDIYEFAQNIEIFLHNNLASSPNLNLLSRALKEKMNLFEMTLTKIVSLEPKVELTHVGCEIDFSQSIVSKIFEFDKRFNEYRFVNTFAFVNKEDIKDMYCPNSIGFLATEENTKDQEFRLYLKELEKRFPTTQLIAFCFTQYEISKAHETFNNELYNIKYLIPENILSLANQVEFYVHNHKLGVFTKIVHFLDQYATNILTVLHTFKAKNSIALQAKPNQHQQVIKNLSPLRVKNHKSDSYYDVIYNDIMTQISNYDFKLNEDKSTYELRMYDDIRLGLQFNKFKKIYHKIKQVRMSMR